MNAILSLCIPHVLMAIVAAVSVFPDPRGPAGWHEGKEGAVLLASIGTI